jgi:deoxycytidylate deaminase
MANILNIATKYANRAYSKRHRHIAIVEKGGAIQSIGYNHRQDMHAEVNALQSIWPSKRVGTTVWSLRLGMDGNLCMAKPCSDCEAFLRANGIKTVYYSDETGSIIKMKL